MFLPLTWILGTSELEPFESSLIDRFFQGLVGACGISVLWNLMRIHLFIQTCSDSETENERSKRSSSASKRLLIGNWKTVLHFWWLTVLLSLVGSRVSSLIVLEFSLRVVSAWLTAGLDSPGRGPQLLLIQCQFSLGCALSCSVAFLQQGAPHSSLNLFLAAGLAWVLASVCHQLWCHVARLYPLHSTERYCGKCITLLTSGHNILVTLQRLVVLAFALAAAASTATVYDHFLSQKDALKFWTPLTLCYTMLVVYIQGDEEQLRQTGAEALLHSVVLRLGALLVLMLTVGHWSDVLQVLVTFQGEVACLLQSKDLLEAISKEEEDSSLTEYDSSSSPTTRGSTSTTSSGGS